MSTTALERENRDLKRTLRLMVSKAEDNESILSGFFALELKLLRCKKLQALLHTVLIEMKAHFRICSVDLLLLDPEHSARQLLEPELLEQYRLNLRFLDNAQLLTRLFPRQQMLVGSALENPELANAFPASREGGSSVLVPLLHGEYVIGGLHLYSKDAERYSHKYRYDYVSHTASVLAICIENCISHENLHRVSMIDMLTKVMNRRSFDKEILRELSRTSREEVPLSCLFLDLDHFKKVNDTFGHLSGDQVLRTVGQLLKGSVRKTDLVARYGGEEFAILLPGCNEDAAARLAEQLRVKVQAMVFRSENGHPFRMSTSIGVSTCDPAAEIRMGLSDMANELIHAADKAVYRAKHSGRNCVCAEPFPPEPLYGKAQA